VAKVSDFERGSLMCFWQVGTVVSGWWTIWGVCEVVDSTVKKKS